MLKEAPSRPGWGFFVQNRSWKAHETHFNIAFDRPAGAYAGRMLRHRVGNHLLHLTMPTVSGRDCPRPMRRRSKRILGSKRQRLPSAHGGGMGVRLPGRNGYPLQHGSLHQCVCMARFPWLRPSDSGTEDAWLAAFVMSSILFNPQLIFYLFTAWRQPPQHWLFAYCPVSSAASLPGF